MDDKLNNARYVQTLPDAEDFYQLFLTTGWNKKYNLSKEELVQAISTSWFFISVYRGQQLIGCGRIISDGVLHAFIVEMIVHPDFQNMGVGRRILDRLLEKCRENNIRDIQLFSAGDKAGFYTKAGFTERPANAPGMELKKME